jgi:hypothetical protein
VSLDRNEVQPPGSRGIVAPRLPGRQEVGAQPEAGFQHDPLRAPGPAPRQIIATEEDMPRLAERAVAAGVDVAVAATERMASGIEFEIRRFNLAHRCSRRPV